jgi:hypothetical protein
VERELDAENAAKSVLGDLLQEFEDCCKQGSEVDIEKLDSVTQHIVQVTRVHNQAAAGTIHPVLHTLYEEWQMRALKAKKDPSLSQPSVCFADMFGAMFAKLLMVCFPVTDARHPICTPLSIWLSGTLAQNSILSLHQVSLALFRLTLVLEFVTEAERFCQEPFFILCNLLTLCCPGQTDAPGDSETSADGFERRNPWLPRTVHELPVTLGLLHIDPGEVTKIPQLEEGCTPDQADQGAIFGDESIPRLQLTRVLLSEPDATPMVKAQLLKAVLQHVNFFHTIYCNHPAYPEMFGMVLQTLQNVVHAVPSVLAKRCKALMAEIERITDVVRSQRRPITMRVRRPIPLKLLEPLITLPGDAKEKRANRTKREEKKEYRRHLKAAVKAIRGDARYLQQAREAEAAKDDEIRTAKYNSLVSDLQEQRHMVGQYETPWSKKLVKLQREKMITAHQAEKARQKDEREAKAKEARERLKSDRFSRR